MRTRSDILLIAALEVSGILPSAVTEALIRLYDQPAPVNYETALGLVSETLGQAVDDAVIAGLLSTDDTTVGESPAVVSNVPQLAATWESCVPCQSAAQAGGDGLSALAGIVGSDMGIGSVPALRVIFFRFHNADHVWQP